MLTWIGNTFIVAGLWGVGNRNRSAFLLFITGESLWIAASYLRHDWALFSICWVFLLMALRGYWLWGKNES